MSTEVDFGSWWNMYLAPGQTASYWLTWAFDSDHLVLFDATPMSDNSAVQITEQWGERDIYGHVTRFATIRNRSTTFPALFRFRCVQVPNKW
jgi:hypothetical protein